MKCSESAKYSYSKKRTVCVIVHCGTYLALDRGSGADYDLSYIWRCYKPISGRSGKFCVFTMLLVALLIHCDCISLH
jgi:hypothetical protein